MKQREGLFRRSTKATSILQWIEECMAKESWWIHVQSSADMFPVAPTPPATPSAQRIDEEIEISSGSFNPMMALFGPRSSAALADMISPRPEDRVLDCALLVSRVRSNEKVVVLSNSVTLKIKAMAEVSTVTTQPCLLCAFELNLVVLRCTRCRACHAREPRSSASPSWTRPPGGSCGRPAPHGGRPGPAWTRPRWRRTTTTAATTL